MSGRPPRALVGEPNAGKSSLFNALAGGPDALVSPQPGTTRDYLTKLLVLDGISVELIDTAGWAAFTDAIEEQSQKLGSEQMKAADIVLWCVEPGGAFASEVAERLARTEARILWVHTKCDLAGDPRGNRNRGMPGGVDDPRGAGGGGRLALHAAAPRQSGCRHQFAARGAAGPPPSPTTRRNSPPTPSARSDPARWAAVTQNDLLTVSSSALQGSFFSLPIIQSADARK